MIGRIIILFFISAYNPPSSVGGDSDVFASRHPSRSEIARSFKSADAAKLIHQYRTAKRTSEKIRAIELLAPYSTRPSVLGFLNEVSRTNKNARVKSVVKNILATSQDVKSAAGVSASKSSQPKVPSVGKRMMINSNAY